MLFLLTNEFRVVCEPPLLEILADDLVTLPFMMQLHGRAKSVIQVIERLLKVELKPSSFKPLGDALFHPSRWNAFWNSFGIVCSQMDLRERQSSETSLINILEMIKAKNLPLTIPENTIHSITSIVTFKGMINSHDRGFILWLIETLYGTPVDFINAKINVFKSQVRRTKYGNIHGMTWAVLEPILIGLYFAPYRVHEDILNAIETLVDVLQEDLARRLSRFLLSHVCILYIFMLLMLFMLLILHAWCCITDFWISL